ncbi:MAG TPA: hypothetical protein PKI60_02325 [Oscillospiraceae bacterium]|nr:hypothetical protein [Oscillospiraceae bacterium]
MISKMIKNELISLTPWIFIFDAAAYLISLIFLGLNYSMALGLILGTAVLYINLIQLGISSENVVDRYNINKDVKSSKRYMFSNYLLRYLIIGIAVYISLSVKLGFLFNTVGVVLPLIYPKLIYLIKSLYDRKEDKK